MHKVPLLLYCNTPELLTAINDGFGRVLCGHKGKEMESSKAAFPFSSLVLFLQLLWKEQDKVGIQHCVKPLSLSSITWGSHAAPGMQEWLNKLSKALKDAITCFSLVGCCFSRAS